MARKKVMYETEHSISEEPEEVVLEEEVAPEPVATPILGDEYGEDYYNSYLGQHPYGFHEPWLSFFGAVAERMVKLFNPANAMDAGCGYAILVSELRKRGVDARGFDASRYALEQSLAGLTDEGVMNWHDIREPLDGQYQLVTCIEVLEHLKPEDADKAVATLCNLVAPGGYLVFSSSPFDEANDTHHNVQPESYWLDKFRAHRFFKTGFDVTVICPWAIVLKRR